MRFGEVSIPLADQIDILSGGSAKVSSWSFIVENRLYRSITAVLGGGALAVSGLVLQVYFRNPLAGPGVLGITSGASLGVAFVVLGGFALNGFLSGLGMIGFGVLGALLVLFLLLFLSRFIKNQVTLLVVGLMIGYFTAAFVNTLFLWADQQATREFVIWGLGSFEGLTTQQLVPFIIVILVFFTISLIMSKGLNALALGEEYLRSLGVKKNQLRWMMILVTSALAATVTAYCGPISFIGIAVPQIVRLLFKTKNHALLLPLCLLMGGMLGIGADLLVRLSSNSLPLNTVTALIGAPIIIWTIIKMNRQFARV